METDQSTKVNSEGEESSQTGELVELLKEKLPPGPYSKEDVAGLVTSIVKFEIQETRRFHQGPLPPPDVLAEYGQRIPGLDREIVERANREQLVRHDVIRANIENEKYSLRHNVVLSYLGLASAFVIAMTAIIGGIVLLAYGKSAWGVASIITALVSLAAVFITGKVADAMKQASRKDSKSD